MDVGELLSRSSPTPLQELKGRKTKAVPSNFF
jgi:hypothetical protein